MLLFESRENPITSSMLSLRGICVMIGDGNGRALEMGMELGMGMAMAME